MLISYLGTQYAGWQVQPDQPTIEAALENALQRITQQETPVHGAGRTDAGVHALNQTAHFESAANLSSDQWRGAINAHLPRDITVKCVQPVSSEFHARHSSQAKSYRYLIHNRPYPSPFARDRSWWQGKMLDMDAMLEAAEHLLGEHDFSAFRAADCSSPNPVKTIHAIEIVPILSEIATLRVDVTGSSFLQHQVRIMVGTLVGVGLGRFEPCELKVIRDDGSRQRAGVTAPAHGLYVLKVHYAQGVVSWPQNLLDS